MKPRQTESWCVLGGGMLGQTLALRLAKEGHVVTILEAASEAGGLAMPWSLDRITWDKFYHVILPGDRRLLSLLDELGLSNSLVWKRTRTGFFAKGRLSSLDGAIDYLRLPTIGVVAKMRLAFTLMFAARIKDGRPLEWIPVKDWLIRWSGRAAFDRLWRPLLRAKLGENDEIASAAFIWATIRRLYLARSSGAKTEMLGFVDGGYRRILDALRQRLELEGADLITGCPVRQVSRSGDKLLVETVNGRLFFDNVVSTLPSGPTAKLCDELEPAIVSRLDSVVYQGILCASVVLKRPLGGFYLTYLTDPDLPFTAVVEMSSLTGTERFEGRTLVYLPRYVTQDDPYWQLDDGAVRDSFVDGLRRIYPDLSPDEIVAFRLARVRNVMAVPTVGYSYVVPPVMTNVEGFYIANSAQITDGTLNVDATLGVVEDALPQLLSDRSRSTARSAA